MFFIKRLLFWVVGLFIISFGASLTIKADIGAGAWDALNVGLSRIFSLTIGTFVIIVGIILVFVNAALSRRKPQLLTLITVFIIGALIDFWMLIVLADFALPSFILKVLTFIVALLIIGLGVAIYLQPKFPLNPIDQFMVSISERFSVSLVIAKTIGELIALILALIVKGPIGIGTVLAVIGIGPSIQLFNPFFEKLALRLQIKK